MRVVIVDDESLIRMDVVEILESKGVEVVGTGKNGLEAIELTKELRPDCVLMDIQMPVMNGIEAAREISKWKIAPVVLLTAYSQDDLVEKAMASGVYGYLVKPVQEDQILPALRMAIARYQDQHVLQGKVDELTVSLEERKYVAKAVGILQEVHGFSENEAYTKLRTYSMQKGLPILTVCEKIIKQYKRQKDHV